MQFLTEETDPRFRVDGGNGERYLLRIYSDEETTLLDNMVEMFWLTALKRDTDLKIMDPVAR